MLSPSYLLAKKNHINSALTLFPLEFLLVVMDYQNSQANIKKCGYK